MTRRSKRTDDYEVGYGRPPKQARFKPGKSGNPKGRPKGSKNLRSIYRETLFKTIQVKEGGKVRTMNRVEALVTGLIAQGLNGNIRAAESVIRLANQHFPAGEEAQPMQIFLQRFSDGEVLGEYEPQPDGQRRFVPRSEKPKGATKSTDDDNSDG